MSQFALFAVIEGLDGAGKSELLRQLTHHLQPILGDGFKTTFEPNQYFEQGQAIRDVLAKRITVTSRELAEMFAQNRKAHNQQLIVPFLDGATAEQPRVLLCDRYYLSSLVYQSTPDFTMDQVWELNRFARPPHITLFLEADMETCYQRMGHRGGDRELFETNLNVMRDKYEQAIQFLRQRDEHITFIDANKSVPEVLQQAISVLQQYAPADVKIPAVV